MPLARSAFERVRIKFGLFIKYDQLVYFISPNLFLFLLFILQN